MQTLLVEYLHRPFPEQGGPVPAVAEATVGLAQRLGGSKAGERSYSGQMKEFLQGKRSECCARCMPCPHVLTAAVLCSKEVRVPRKGVVLPLPTGSGAPREDVEVAL